MAELRIQDESQATKEKASKRKGTSRQFPLDGSCLVPALDERARNAFFAHFVSGISRSCHIVESLCARSPERHLAASLDAVSLAYFSLQYQHHGASRLSKERYTDALVFINRTLEIPSLAASDSTLQAVLLLDLYEKVTGNTSQSAVSWMSHVNGALALSQLCSTKQLREPTRLQLSVRLSVNVLVSCTATHAPVPSSLLQLRSNLEPLVDTQDPKWRITDLFSQYANLRLAAKQGRLWGPDLIMQALDLDQRFVSVQEDLPAPWKYERIYVNESSDKLLERYYDVYSDHYITQTWNILRLDRILLQDLIRQEYVAPSPGSCEEAFLSYFADRAKTSIDTLAGEICSSVPQFIPYNSNGRDRSCYTDIQKLQCHTLLFYLYVAARFASHNSYIKPWVIKQLRYMSEDMSIRDADVVLNVLKQPEQPDPWKIHTLLGSYALAA